MCDEADMVSWLGRRVAMEVLTERGGWRVKGFLGIVLTGEGSVVLGEAGMLGRGRVAGDIDRFGAELDFMVLLRGMLFVAGDEEGSTTVEDRLGAF